MNGRSAITSIVNQLPTTLDEGVSCLFARFRHLSIHSIHPITIRDYLGEACVSINLQTPAYLYTPQGTTLQVCTNVTISWHGGGAPYDLSMVQRNSGTGIYRGAAVTRATFYVWTVNADVGTDVVITIADAQGRGVSTPLLSVEGDSSCLSSGSPQSIGMQPDTGNSISISSDSPVPAKTFTSPSSTLSITTTPQTVPSEISSSSAPLFSSVTSSNRAEMGSGMQMGPSQTQPFLSGTNSGPVPSSSLLSSTFGNSISHNHTPLIAGATIAGVVVLLVSVCCLLVYYRKARPSSGEPSKLSVVTNYDVPPTSDVSVESPIKFHDGPSDTVTPYDIERRSVLTSTRTFSPRSLAASGLRANSVTKQVVSASRFASPDFSEPWVVHKNRLTGEPQFVDRYELPSLSVHLVDPYIVRERDGGVCLAGGLLSSDLDAETVVLPPAYQAIKTPNAHAAGADACRDLMFNVDTESRMDDH
ncbi:hypothetical protein NM688_g7539 [Phlebia brevispora]|uniref:Uncharacterized protein n=1 Tax=Phlebia brevispora TaxID=194682 RepID=A0ACC1S409_9APHY|nr:hypothetical protein NM688_g7539 [Phlebia brevispora]